MRKLFDSLEQLRGESMTREEYFQFHRAACDKMIETTRKKNHDYAGQGDDPFSNFSRVEVIGICSTEQGFLTRMFDKFARITTFVQKGVLLVADESVEDTLLDLANYCILMAGYIRSKRELCVEDAAGKKLIKEHTELYSQKAASCEGGPNCPEGPGFHNGLREELDANAKKDREWMEGYRAHKKESDKRDSEVANGDR